MPQRSWHPRWQVVIGRQPRAHPWEQALCGPSGRGRRVGEGCRKSDTVCSGKGTAQPRQSRFSGEWWASHAWAPLG